MNDFIILGGDLRFIYTAAKLACPVYGFDTVHEDVRKDTGVTILKKIEKAKNVILPLPMSRNCDFITAPYTSEKIPIEKAVNAAACENATIYCGKACPVLHKICRERGFTLVDYFEREEMTVLNAAVTSEGAIEIIMREKALAVMGMNILITGYGRIAKVLSQSLHALGANVTVSARKFSDLAWARITGCSAVHIDDIDWTLSAMDTVVNTVPIKIFDKDRLIKLKSDCLLIDLASKSGVGSLETAKEAGVKVIWALSIPGKVAPVTSGEIIADTINNIINETKGNGNSNEHNK
jgi:dipicolinate synthase subunit A